MPGALGVGLWLTLKGRVKEDNAVKVMERQGQGEEAPRVALSS